MNEAQLDFDRFLLAIEKTISSPSFYFQSLSVIACLILGYIFYSISRRHFLPKLISFSLKKNIALHRLITRYLIPILYYVITILLLIIVNSIYLQFFKENQLFDTTIQLIGLFIFLRFMRISSDNSFFANGAGLILVPAMILNILGIL